MSRIKLLKNVADDMQELAASLRILADAIASDEIPEQEAESETKALSLSDMQTILIPLAQEGHNKQIKTALTTIGAEKLSDAKPEDYQALLKEVDRLIKEANS